MLKNTSVVVYLSIAAHTYFHACDSSILACVSVYRSDKLSENCYSFCFSMCNIWGIEQISGIDWLSYLDGYTTFMMHENKKNVSQSPKEHLQEHNAHQVEF